jgi:class 3 adenylate cyclase
MNPLEEFDQLVEKQVNATLQIGSLASALLGYTSGVILWIGSYFKLAENIEVPIFWTFLGGSYSLFVYYLSKNERVTNILKYIVMLGFVSLPSVIYLIAYLSLPAGSATYINGPPSYLYFFLIIVTGFSFDFKLSFFSGLFAALQYSLIIYCSTDEIYKIQHNDSLMQQDNRFIMFYYFRPIMMVISGYAIATIGNHVRSLISDTIEKEREKSYMNRIFGQYVSPEVREKVLQEKVALKGEKKIVAVLFCDIRGFTSMSENKPPEEIVFELNEYFNVMADAISSANGTIDKFIGDAIMAVFGGVIALDNSASSALCAARLMIKNLEILNEDRVRRGLPEIRNGIGLHYGEVFIGAIGSENRKDYTVIGDIVNTTSRIESLCKEHKVSILMSEKFCSELPPEQKANCYHLTDTLVKGRKEMITLYAVK